MTTPETAPVEVTQALEPCPWCKTTDHLSHQWPGSMTADMPDRPCRVICTHIDHDTVVGPTAYGKWAATKAWNSHRTTPEAARQDVREALAEAYRKGATDVHTYWQRNPGEPPQGDPEFGEAASDYAAAAMDIYDSSAALSTSPLANEAPMDQLQRLGQEFDAANDTGALRDIAAERARQVSVEGWTPEHDDEHADAQMAGAAACYAMSAIPHWAKHEAIRLLWPWAKNWWKPRSHRENLIRAGALIVAEIERLDRAALASPDDGEGK